MARYVRISVKVLLNRNEEREELVMECGCGRSPTGKCCGWHALSEEEYEQELMKLEAKARDDELNKNED